MTNPEGAKAVELTDDQREALALLHKAALVARERGNRAVTVNTAWLLVLTNACRDALARQALKDTDR